MDNHSPSPSSASYPKNILNPSLSNLSPNLSYSLRHPASINSLPSLHAISLLPPLNSPSSSSSISTTKSTLVDVVVEGMGGANALGLGWQVPPELVFFLRSLGDRLDPFSPTGRLSSSNATPPIAHSKSLTAALNHATLRPNSDQPAIINLFTELVLTERTYLKRISALNQSYAIPLKQFSKSDKTKIIDKYEATSMFGKIDAIVAVNSSLLAVLDHALAILERQPGSIDWAAKLSTELLNIRGPYRDYLAAYDSIKDTEQKLLKKSDSFRQFCERTKEAMYDDGMGRVGLRELLMEPVQRVTRYILIFEQILKKMSSNDPARSSLLACIETCNRLAVCELDDHLIKAATMWGLHRSIDHFPAIFIKPGRYFIDSIDVLDVIPDTPSPTVLHCTLFLFNDTIIIAKKPANSQFTGKVLAGLDDMDRLVAAMKKSKSTTSSLNSVVSGGTDFLAKSLGGSSHHNTPTKLKKGSMRFKGMVDVHDVIVANDGLTSSEASFDLYLDRPPQHVSGRWTDRPLRHYVVCPLPTQPLSSHEKSLSLPSTHQPTNHHHHHSHSLSHKSHSATGSQSLVASLAERDRFLDNLRKSQALVKAADDRSTVMRTKFVDEADSGGTIDSFWNLYDKRTYLTEQRKHRVVLQLVGIDPVDPLQFPTEPIDSPRPVVIIRANFNDIDDPDCRVTVRRRPMSGWGHLVGGAEGELQRGEGEEEVVVGTGMLNSLVVRIIQSYGMADIPLRSTSAVAFPSTAGQPASGVGHPSSPSRVFRGTHRGLPGPEGAPSQRLFGSQQGLQRAKSATSRASQTRSPGGPVWYRHGLAAMREEEGPREGLYERMRAQEERLSPARSTLKGKGRAGREVESVESQSRCSSVSGLSSTEGEGECKEEESEAEHMASGGRRVLVGPRQPRDSPMRAASEPASRMAKPPALGGLRGPGAEEEYLGGQASRNVSGSSIGKRSRSVEPSGAPDGGFEQDGSERAKRVAGGNVLPLVVNKKAVLGGAGVVDGRRVGSGERRKEERKVGSRRRKNHHHHHQNQQDQLMDRDENGRGVENNKSGLVEGEELSEALVVEVEGSVEFVRSSRRKVEKMKELIRKLIEDDQESEWQHEDYEKEEEGSESRQSGSRGGGGSRVMSESSSVTIPRSPRKLDLSELANLGGKHSGGAGQGARKVMRTMRARVGELEKLAGLVERDLKEAEWGGKVVRGRVEEVKEAFLMTRAKLEQRVTELRMKEEAIKVMSESYRGLEVENGELYEAFNEELDKMYGDIQLPDGLAIGALVDDVKRLAMERGRLTTKLGSTQRQLEMEVAKSECLEGILKEAGLLFSNSNSNSNS